MVATAAQVADALLDNVDRVVRGKRDEIRLALCCLLTEGHLLLDDVPGTGKTSLAKAIANSIAGTWTRVQFTTSPTSSTRSTPSWSGERATTATTAPARWC